MLFYAKENHNNREPNKRDDRTEALLEKNKGSPQKPTTMHLQVFNSDSMTVLVYLKSKQNSDESNQKRFQFLVEKNSNLNVINEKLFCYLCSNTKVWNLSFYDHYAKNSTLIGS